MDSQQTEAIIRRSCDWLHYSYENFQRQKHYSSHSPVDVDWGTFEDLFSLPSNIALSLTPDEVMLFLSSTLSDYPDEEGREKARVWWVGHTLHHWEHYKNALYDAMISNTLLSYQDKMSDWLTHFPLLKTDPGVLRSLRRHLVSWSAKGKNDYQLKYEQDLVERYAIRLTLRPFARELLYAPLKPHYFEAIRSTMAEILLHECDITAWTVLNYAVLAEASDEEVRQQFTDLDFALEPVLQLVGLLREVDIYPIEPTRYSLRDMTPQAIASWRNALCTIIVADHSLRDCALEALCFYARVSDDNIVLQAMIQAYPDVSDSALLDMAFKHPHALVRRRAAASFDMLPDAASLIRGRITPVQTAVTPAITVAARPETLIDDAEVEAIILATLQQQAGKFSQEVTSRLRIDEEQLTSRFFTLLEATFDSVNKQINLLTEATTQTHKLDFNVKYRPVSKYEEGSTGINLARSFSADLCVIIDYQDQGVSYAKRATLIQLKKMQRTTGRYPLNVEQFDHLAQQTSSAFLMLMGTAYQDVHLPVLPVGLCLDLDLKADLSPTRASSLGRPFADWFFRDVIGLWTGDANPVLIAKAEGDSTNVPFDLINFTINKVSVGQG